MSSLHLPQVIECAMPRQFLGKTKCEAPPMGRPAHAAPLSLVQALEVDPPGPGTRVQRHGPDGRVSEFNELCR